ncbi:MAG: YceI family protein [Deltaproteobacteria bacterium]|nr:YceI family protein [Deltaproteobacteria bacterium]MBW2552226.1 YceI family protein [Deltaproteobacteria bacterium]MBW2688004.1 YceI family protein [Deltaproteobacteria bacterium]
MYKRKQSMKHLVRNALGAALGVVLVSSTAFAAFSALKLDRTHSTVSFTAETVIFDVDGEFGEYNVEIEGDPAKPATVKVKASIGVASINTQNAKRDKHLKSPDFFDVEKYPTITFASTSVRSKGGQLLVKGNLTMHGTTKQVTLPFKVAKGKNGAGMDTTTYKAKLTLDRNDYGIGTDSIAAKISLEDEVSLKLVIVTFQ